MKIGIDIRAIGKKRTGDEYYTLNLVKNILDIDKENQYFLLTNTKEISDVEEKVFAGKQPKNAEIISITPGSKLIWTIFLLPLKAKKLGLDVLHVQYITPLWLSKKIKLVTTIADVSFKALPQFINKIDLLLLNFFIPFSLKRADRVIAVSDFTKKEILKYYKLKEDKVRVVYNGGAGDGDEKEVKGTLNIEHPFIFYVGTHQPRKDVPTLIKSFLEMKGNNPDSSEIRELKLVIGGKIKAHNYDKKIDEVLRYYKIDPQYKNYVDDVVFTGYLEKSELKKIFQKAEIFVFPSLYEGFGLPLIEAMEAKTPVVCSDIDCFKEVAGDAAVFYEAGNPGDLQKVLKEVILNPKLREDLIQKGIKRSKDFSWRQSAQETLDVFSK